MPKKTSAPKREPLTAGDLIVGHTYAAKRPVLQGLFPSLYNDRQIVWIGLTEVQYDSPAVRPGRHLPLVTIEKFLTWAEEDITSKMPPGEWREGTIAMLENG